MKKWLLIFALIMGCPISLDANEYIVKLKKERFVGFSISRASVLNNAIEKIGPNTFLVQGNKESLEKNAEIEYVEPNSKVNILGWEVSPTGNKADLDEKAWGISQVKAPMLWKEEIKGSKDIVIAVIDTGMDYTHPALSHLLWTNEKEIPDNGKDDDENGYIDDVNGWDFYNDDNDPMDDQSHGTHVSGTIGGKDIGIVHEVSIMPLKFLSKYGQGNLADAIKAINYAVDNGADIMSNSWGGGPKSKALEEAIQHADEHGVIFIAASGNSFNDNDKYPAYPASYDIKNVISVAASDKDDELAFFSNWGEKSVHVAAPGVAIYSSVLKGKYQAFSGTSMAAPHISGIAVLLLQGGFHPMKIVDLLMMTSDPFPTLLVKSKGRVNSYRAFHNLR